MGQVARWELANRGCSVITSCLYCSIGDRLMTMLFGMWLEVWEVRMQGSDSTSEGPCCPKYMAIHILMRMNMYHLCRWRVQSEPPGVEQKGMTDLDDMNLTRMNNTILFTSLCRLEAQHPQLRTWLRPHLQRTRIPPLQ